MPTFDWICKKQNNMAKVHKVAGYDGFISFISDLEKSTKDTLIAYFTGSKDEAGKSWCPDCNDGKQNVKLMIRIK